MSGVNQDEGEKKRAPEFGLAFNIKNNKGTSLLRFNISGRTLWLLYALILSAVVLAHPHQHTVTAYRDAAEDWVHHADLYDLGSIHGFLYLPQSAIAFVPILWMPFAMGEVVWRLIGIGLLAGTIAALARTLPLRKGVPWFLLLSALVIPSSFASARNGQTNLDLAACFLWTALALDRSRWNLAAVLLIVCMVLKPVALVPILLIGALYPPMRLRLALGLVGFLAIPFLDFHWGYVLHQYDLCFQKLAIASEPMEHGFCDFSGMIWTFTGAPLPSRVTQAIGIVMALVTLGLGWRARKVDAASAAFWIVALSSTYLMLFNPRTESNSYVILATAALPFMAEGFLRGRGWPSIAFLLSLGCDSYSNPIHPWTHLWLKALLGCVFLVWLGFRLIWRQSLQWGRIDR